MKHKRKCLICDKIIKSGNISLNSFEDIFKKHIKKHKLYTKTEQNKQGGEE